MTIAGQLREEAIAIANSRALEIFEAAQQALTSSRFDRLCKHKAIPQNNQERDYMHALHQYVNCKLKLRRFKGSEASFGWHGLYRDKIRWREQMDRIEFGLNSSWRIPIPATPNYIEINEGR